MRVNEPNLKASALDFDKCVCFPIERIENDYKWPTGLLFRHGHFQTPVLGPGLVPC